MHVHVHCICTVYVCTCIRIIETCRNSYSCILELKKNCMHHIADSWWLIPSPTPPPPHTHTHKHTHSLYLHYNPYPGSVRPHPWVWLTLRTASYLRWCLETGRWGCSRFSLASYTECLMRHLTYSPSSNRLDNPYIHLHVCVDPLLIWKRDFTKQCSPQALSA